MDAHYRLVLGLVRHTAAYSPPVASRAFAYLGVTGYEAIAGGPAHMSTLAGHLTGLEDLPHRLLIAGYDESIVLDAALSLATRHFFNKTGPTGQRAMEAMEARLGPTVSEGLPTDVVERSQAYGRTLAAAVGEWADGDGRAEILNMGFPLEHKLREGPEYWRPTSTIAQQQTPLLPDWGQTRTFAMPAGDACALPAPTPFSTERSSQFYREAKEVDTAVAHLTPEQKAIARFWSDDPMLSTTPPGHWTQIALKLSDENKLPIDCKSARNSDPLRG